MEFISFKNKNFEIIEKLGANSFKVSFKNKIFFLKKFSLETNELDSFIKTIKKISVSGIQVPKLLKIDKKNGLVLLQFIEGENVLDIISKGELSKEIYKLIFEASWFSLFEKIKVSYHPDKWIYSHNKLFYVGYFFLPNNEKFNNFEKEEIFLWVYSKQLIDYLVSKNYSIDQSRVKSTFETNKEVVMLVCQYHL